MAILKILQYPDSLLRRKGYQVSDVSSPIIQSIIDDMLETLLNTQSCMALAATQLAIDIPPNITVVHEPKAQGGVICLVNPEIILAEGEISDYEGCMSIAEVNAVVTRAAQVKVKALDRLGNTVEITAKDYLARCFQHEIDHLKGILYIDKLSSLKRSRLLRKLEKMQNR